MTKEALFLLRALVVMVTAVMGRVVAGDDIGAATLGFLFGILGGLLLVLIAKGTTEGWLQ